MLKLTLLEQPLFLETQIQCVLYKHKLGGAHTQTHHTNPIAPVQLPRFSFPLYKWQERKMINFFLLTFYSVVKGGTSGSLLAFLVSPNKLCRILTLPLSGDGRPLFSFRTWRCSVWEDCCSKWLSWTHLGLN